MMGVLEPLEEEMRMSESISLPNGVAMEVQSLLFFFFLHVSVMLLLGKETQEGEGLTAPSKINKQQLK